MEENEYREEDVDGKLEYLKVRPGHLESLLTYSNGWSGQGKDERQRPEPVICIESQTTTTAFLMPPLILTPLRAYFTPSLSYTTATTGYLSSRLGVCILTRLRIRARIPVTTHFVMLNTTMRLLVRAGCVASSKHTERVGRSVLLDEILCNLNLSTYC